LRTSPPLIRKLFILIAVSSPWRNCFQGTPNLLHYDAVGISQYAPKPRYNQEASSGLQAGEADEYKMEQQEIGPGFIWDGRDCYHTQTTLAANFNNYLLYLITHRRRIFAIHIKENHRCNNCSCDHPNNSWGAQKVSHSGSNK